MILVTGASGFVGSALVQKIIESGNYTPKVAVRKTIPELPENITQSIIENLDKSTNWHNALKGANVVIHSAARAHIVNETAEDSMAEFRKTNVEGTLNLAKQALDAGVKRFIYISSIKVNGENTALNMPFKADDQPNPIDPYGISKYEAEQGLKEIASQTGMEVVIIRPPLVYGPNVKANFLSMMSWLYKSVPLPLGSIHNQRSLVALDNLIDLIHVCIKHSAATNQTFLVNDDEDLSTTELFKRMAKALGKPSRLIPIPSGVLTATASLLGKRDIAQRLCGSLQVDIEHTKETLDWNPPISVDEALQKTADTYLKQLKK